MNTMTRTISWLVFMHGPWPMAHFMAYNKYYGCCQNYLPYLIYTTALDCTLYYNAPPNTHTHTLDCTIHQLIIQSGKTIPS